MGVVASFAAALLLPLGGTAAHAAAPDTIIRTSPGTSSWTVPAGVHSVQLRVVGGEGGRGGTDMGGAWGGVGAAVTGTLEVTPGETLQLRVASRGGDGANGSGSDSGGSPGSGWSDGGRGGNGSRFLGADVGWGAGGGGGSSAVIRNGSAVVVAGGGGGGGGRAYCDGNPGGNGGASGSKVNNSCASNGGDPGIVGASGNAQGLAGENGSSGAGQGGGGGGGGGVRGGGGADHSTDGGGGGGGGTSLCDIGNCVIGVGEPGHGSIRIMPVHTPVVSFDEVGYGGHTGTAITFAGRVFTQHSSGGTPEGTVTLEAVSASGESAELGIENLDAQGRFSFSCTVSCGTSITDVTTVRAVFTSANTSQWTTATGAANLSFINAETQTTLFIDPSSAVTGQLRDFTATVSVLQPALGAVHGDVEFRMSDIDGGNEVVLGTAPLAANYQAAITAGVPEASDKRFWAVYLGAGSFNGSASPKQTLSTEQASTMISGQTTPHPTVTGQDFTLEIRVDVLAPGAGVPTGAVQIITASGQIEQTLDAAGTVSIPMAGQGASVLEYAIAYLGDANFGPSVGSVTHTIERAQVDLGLSLDVAESAYGESFTLTSTAAVVLPGQGTVVGEVEFGIIDESGGFARLGDPVALEAGAAELTITELAAGVYVFEARYAQTDDFLAAVSPRVAHEVSAAATTVTVTPVPETNVYSLTQHVRIQVSGADQNPGELPADGEVRLIRVLTDADAGEQDLSEDVTLDENGEAVISLEWLEPGAYEVYAIYAGSQNFLASTSEPAVFTIERAVSGVSVRGAATAVIDQEQSFTVEVGAYESADAEGVLSFAPTGTIEVLVDGESIAAEVELTERPDGSFIAVATVHHTFSAVGDYEVIALYDGDHHVIGGTSSPLIVQAMAAAAPKRPDASGRLPQTGQELPVGMLATAVLMLLVGCAAALRKRVRAAA